MTMNAIFAKSHQLKTKDIIADSAKTMIFAKLAS